MSAPSASPAPAAGSTRRDALRRPAERAWLTGALCALALSAPVLLLTEILNPDWFGYAQIFEEGGAWLADQGRDPLFLALMDAAAGFFGADGYEDFRSALGWAFIGFGAWLGLGAGWQRAPGAAVGGLGLALAVVNFGMTRFSVQIREGVAVVLVLLALRWASHERHRVGTTCLLIGASLIHSGTVLILLGWLLAGFSSARAPLRAADRLRRGALGLAAGFLLGLLAFEVLGAGVAAEDLFNRAEQAETEGLSKFLYWTLLGACTWVVAHTATAAHADGPSHLSRAVQHWSWLLMPAIFGLLLAEFATEQPLVVIASTARALALFHALLLLLAALRGRWTWSAGVVTAFLIADQGRTLVQALSGAAELLGG